MTPIQFPRDLLGLVLAGLLTCGGLPAAATAAVTPVASPQKASVGQGRSTKSTRATPAPLPPKAGSEGAQDPATVLAQLEETEASQRAGLKRRLEDELAHLGELPPPSSTPNACPTSVEGPTARQRFLADLDKTLASIQQWNGAVSRHGEIVYLQPFLTSHCCHIPDACPEYNQMCYWARVKAAHWALFQAAESRFVGELLNYFLAPGAASNCLTSEKTRRSGLAAGQLETLGQLAAYLKLLPQVERAREKKNTAERTVGLYEFPAGPGSPWFTDNNTLVGFNRKGDVMALNVFRRDASGRWNRQADVPATHYTNPGGGIRCLHGGNPTVCVSQAFGMEPLVTWVDYMTGRVLWRYKPPSEMKIARVVLSPAGMTIGLLSTENRLFLLKREESRAKAVDNVFRREIEVIQFVDESTLRCSWSSTESGIRLHRDIRRNGDSWEVSEIQETSLPRRDPAREVGRHDFEFDAPEGAPVRVTLCLVDSLPNRRRVSPCPQHSRPTVIVTERATGLSRDLRMPVPGSQYGDGDPKTLKAVSPDGNTLAFVVSTNLWLVDVRSNAGGVEQKPGVTESTRTE